MLVAITSAHWSKGFFGPGGYELPFMYLVAAAVSGIAGPGAYSLDSAAGISLPEPLTGVVAAAAAVAGVLVALAGRERQAQPATDRPAGQPA
jgi:putative oxidoreductase